MVVALAVTLLSEQSKIVFFQNVKALESMPPTVPVPRSDTSA